MAKGSTRIEIIQYIVLIFVLAVSSLFFSQIGDPVGRFLIIVLVGIFYVGWGCWHHGYKERLTSFIIFEYLIVSLIIVLLAALGLGIIRFF